MEHLISGTFKSPHSLESFNLKRGLHGLQGLSPRGSSSHGTDNELDMNYVVARVASP